MYGRLVTYHTQNELRRRRRRRFGLVFFVILVGVIVVVVVIVRKNMLKPSAPPERWLCQFHEFYG